MDEQAAIRYRPATIRSGGLDVSTAGLPASIRIQARTLEPDAIGETYWIDVNTFDRVWRETDPGMYLSDNPPQGWYDGSDQAAEISGRRARFLEWLRAFGSKEKMLIPQVGYGAGGIGFIDGRHRFSVLRDLGVDKIPIMLDFDTHERRQQFLDIFVVDPPENSQIKIPPLNGEK